MFGIFGSILSPSELSAPMAKDQPQLRSCPIITLTTMNVLDVRATCSLAELEIYSRRGTTVAPPAGGCVPSPCRHHHRGQGERRQPVRTRASPGELQGLSPAKAAGGSAGPPTRSEQCEPTIQRYPRSSHFAKIIDQTVSQSEMPDLCVRCRRLRPRI